MNETKRKETCRYGEQASGSQWTKESGEGEDGGGGLLWDAMKSNV